MRQILERLLETMREITKHDVCVAFSGGVDSSLLLRTASMAAEENGTKVYAVTISTRLQPWKDMEIARNVAQECGCEHHVLAIDESKNEKILNNSVDRCYWCKRFLFESLLKWGSLHGVATTLEGSNADDLEMYRPGWKAVKELGVRSPLAELGISKEEVRRMAAQLKLSVAKRPSTPCMATRIPYDTPLDFSALRKLEEGEQQMRDLGFDVVRLRLHGEIVRVEVDKEKFAEFLLQREHIVEILKGLGFRYITLDLEGFRSGSMDL